MIRVEKLVVCKRGLENCHNGSKDKNGDKNGVLGRGRHWRVGVEC